MENIEKTERIFNFSYLTLILTYIFLPWFFDAFGFGNKLFPLQISIAIWLAIYLFKQKIKLRSFLELMPRTIRDVLKNSWSITYSFLAILILFCVFILLIKIVGVSRAAQFIDRVIIPQNRSTLK